MRLIQSIAAFLVGFSAAAVAAPVPVPTETMDAKEACVPDGNDSSWHCFRRCKF
ncbi:hypothetical protein F4861DRAFT_539065 [Xylaria intraflava]|nr:hypothetical protein F4861DRAFT_539065 [Xylaria intraflava]